MFTEKNMLKKCVPPGITKWTIHGLWYVASVCPHFNACIIFIHINLSLLVLSEWQMGGLFSLGSPFNLEGW